MKCVRFSSFVLFALLGVFFGSFIINQTDTFAVADLSQTYTANSSVSSDSNVIPSCSEHCLDDYHYLIISVSSTSFVTNYSTLWIRFDGSNIRNLYYNTYSSLSILALPFDGHNDNLLVFGRGIFFPFDTTFTLTENNPYSSGVIPSGSLSITENGTYDVTDYAEVVVNIPETDCPPSSGSIYHDDLVSINNSILICSATCLVIYFFYCIYRMIIKNSGVK